MIRFGGTRALAKNDCSRRIGISASTEWPYMVGWRYLQEAGMPRSIDPCFTSAITGSIKF
jgi:hypothetical protein